MQKAKGVTMIELMIIVAILGILAVVAIPSYNSYMLKGRRSDGKTALIELQLAQEKLRANCKFYAKAIANANSCGSTAALTTVIGSALSPEGFYKLSITASSGNSYTLSAAGLNDQANDTNCTPLTLTHPGGAKAPSGCW